MIKKMANLVTRVMIAGINGKLGMDLARAINAENDPTLQLFGLGIGGHADGKSNKPSSIDFSDKRRVGIVPANHAEELFKDLRQQWPGLIMIDATKGPYVADNAARCDKYNIPFIVLATGGKIGEIKNVPYSVIPNAARPIARMNDMLYRHSLDHPNSLSGCVLNVRESHQATKPDFSGTATKVISYFEAMGAQAGLKEKRRTDTEFAEWEIPEEHRKRHGWHRYEVRSDQECRGLIKLTRAISDFFHSDESLKDYSEEANLGDGTNGYSRLSASKNARFELGTSIPNGYLLNFGTFINGGEIYGPGAILALRKMREGIDSGAVGEFKIAI